MSSFFLFSSDVVSNYSTLLFSCGLFAAPVLMEAITTSRVVPVQLPCRRKLSSLFANSSCIELRRYPCRGLVSIMHHPKLLRPVTASVQPQELSALGHESNVVPSKGKLLLLVALESVVFGFRE